MDNKPIKRSSALMPLSKEHHFDLLLAWKLRKGLGYEVDPERMAAYVHYLDENLMRAHFADEEKELFDRISPEDEKIIRARKEHDEIRNLVNQIVGEKSSDPEVFRQLADKVEAHVRYEERELFPYLEQKLTPEVLRQVEKTIHEKHEGFNEVWEDVFWVSH